MKSLSQFGLLRIIALGLYSLFWSCAHIESPPGGPEDKLVPYATAQYPAPGALNQPRNLQAAVEFSEWMSPTAAPAHIQVTPALSRKFHPRWEGKVLILEYKGLLDTLTTYTLTLQPQFTDLAGNKMSAQHKIVFATGPQLDTATLSVRLPRFLPQEGSPRNYLGALYPEGLTRFSLSYLNTPHTKAPDSLPAPAFERPMYIGNIDSTGLLVIQNVRKGLYSLLVFNDLNGDQKPQIGTEPLGIGTSALKPGHSEEQHLIPTPYDTLSPTVQSVKFKNLKFSDSSKASTSGLLLVQFKQPLDTSYFNPAHFFLTQTDTPDTLKISQMYYDSQEKSLVFPLSSLAAQKTYTIHIQQITGVYGDTLKTPLKSVFTIPDTLHTFNTTLKHLSPQPTDSLVFREGVLMYREKPIEPFELDSLSKMYRFSSETDTLPPVPLLRNSHLLLLKPTGLEHKGQVLSLDMLSPQILKKDSSDRINPIRPEDSSKHAKIPPSPQPTFEKTPSSPESISTPRYTSVWKSQLAQKGKWASLNWEQQSHMGNWVISLHSRSQIFPNRFLPQKNRVTWDSLPAGFYTYSAFLDLNGNGRWDPGKLSPWKAQEPRWYFTDTLHLKAQQSHTETLSWPPKKSEVLKLQTNKN